jgi:hypothetical protein
MMLSSGQALSPIWVHIARPHIEAAAQSLIVPVGGGRAGSQVPKMYSEGAFFKGESSMFFALDDQFSVFFFLVILGLNGFLSLFI